MSGRYLYLYLLVYTLNLDEGVAHVAGQNSVWDLTMYACVNMTETAV